MINISLITSLNESECIADLRYIKPNGEEHKRLYRCERYSADSTHRAELKALATGLKELRCPARVTAYLKTPHSIAAINQDWIRGWKNNDWKNAKGNLVRDWEIWKEIYEIVEEKEITLTGGMCSDILGDTDKEISEPCGETG
ncbi:MAG: RNase H family protein [Lachnospiraceae bacterium]|nr:RNase H family protein [Lachnospiraceae bacterium]